MADLSDVAATLGALIGATLYPSGASGEAASPVAGVPVRVEIGWPSPQSLDDAMAAGKSHISIYPQPNQRSTSRAQSEWDEAAINETTYTLVQSGQVITVSGSPPSTFYPQNLLAVVNSTACSTQSGPSDTASTLAAALQALIVVAAPGTTVSGAAITLPPRARIGALFVGANGTAVKEIDRQECTFQVTIWSPAPEDRDAIAKAVDPALRQITNLLLPDQSYGRMRYSGTHQNDFSQKQAIFRRDLFYPIDYPTTVSMTAPQIVSTPVSVTLSP